MKKMSLAVFIFILGITNTQAAFSDVASYDIYKDAIEYVQGQGIVSGYSDGTFRPGNSITRGEFTKMIVGSIAPEYYQTYLTDEDCLLKNNYAMDWGDVYLLGTDKYGETSINMFKDVDANMEHAYSICYAKTQNIISGYSDGTFRMDANITIGEASKIIANAFELVDEEKLASDSSSTFRVYIEALTANNYLPLFYKGVDDYINRGEIAEIVYRVKNNITNKPGARYQDLIPLFGSIQFDGIGKYSENNEMKLFVQGHLPLRCPVNGYCEVTGFASNYTSYRIAEDAKVELMDCTNDILKTVVKNSSELKTEDFDNLCQGGEANRVFELKFNDQTKEVVEMKHIFI
ncbi:S-layer homology domain-containing protein [Candidatus Dojkabacteria bacterium]|nr:S-layer homology domain-containing protein [Candidatus Dojkabacteria bacterium]